MSAETKKVLGPTLIPFGPQHPVLPEPIHLDLVLIDEKVIEAIPQIGYIHLGLELIVEKHDYLDYVHVAERICGICAFMHGMGYCEAVMTKTGSEFFVDSIEVEERRSEGTEDR